jgi:hypothetical protein
MSKRARNPRAKSSPVRPPQQAAASLAGAGGLTALAAIIRPPRTKYGPRKPRKLPSALERAQGEILALYPRALPDVVNMSALTRAVKKRLKKRGLAEVSRQTVIRALEKLREANG